MGYDKNYQYAAIPTVFASMKPYLNAIQQRLGSSPFLLVWGGDAPSSSAPSVGLLASMIKAEYNVKLLAVISAAVGDPNADTTLCDLCFTVPAAMRQTYSNGTLVLGGKSLPAVSSACLAVAGRRCGGWSLANALHFFQGPLGGGPSAGLVSTFPLTLSAMPPWESHQY